jgi:Flp pilus assembly protein TadD
VFNKYYEPHLYTQEPWFDRAHNIFLDWLIAGGLLGLLGYLSLYAFSLYLIWFGVGHTFTHLERAVLTGLLVGYFVNNIFVFDNIGSYIIFFSLLAFIHAHFAKAREWSIPDREQKQTITRIAGPVMAVLLVGVFYFGNWSSMQASFDLIRGMIPAPGGYTQNLEYFEKALSGHTLGLQETREQLMQRALTAENDPNATLDQKTQLKNAARREIEQHIVDFPGDARVHVFYGSYLRLTRDIAGSVRELSRARELSPGKQSIQVELALAQLQNGDTAGALLTAEKAYKLDTSYDMGRMVYVAILNYAGNSAAGDAILMEHYGTTDVDHDILMQTYTLTKQFKKVIALWKARAEKDPENPEVQAQLARAYAQGGEKSAAIAIIESLMKKYPEFAGEGKKVIEDIRAGKL